MLNTKKGNVLDWFIVMSVLFVTAIALFCSYIVIDTVDSTEVFSNDANAQSMITTGKSALLSFDNMMLFIIVGLSVYILISSGIIYNHPAFFWAGIFLLFITITIAGVVSNTFWIFTDTSSISPTAALFPKIQYLMEHLPFYILFMGIAAVLVMYVAYQRQ